MRADIGPGVVFPDYELSDHRGMRRTLSALHVVASYRPLSSLLADTLS